MPQGTNLGSGEDATSFKADSLFIEPTSRAEDAFKAVVQSCIRHFRLNEPLLVDTRAAEPLHQCRVALRCLRSAFALFKDMIVDDEVEGLKERLRAISQHLGEARDLDVFLAKLSRPQDDTVSQADDSEFAEQIRNNREEAYDRVLAALQGTRSKTLMFDVFSLGRGRALAHESRPGRSSAPAKGG